MARHDEIAKIYDHKLTQLRDPIVWEQTLRLTSNFWRLNFCAAMLLVEQNPRAEMCGTFEQWNKVGRYIKRGEHSTVVFKDRTDTKLMYLFDVRQTYGLAYNAKWKMSERMADGIVGKFNAENAENAVSFEDFLQKSLDKKIDMVYNYHSKLNSAIAKDPRISHFIRESAECICKTRCGIEAEYDFADAAKFSNDLSIVEIGNAATALAQEILRDIDRTVRRKDYEHYEAGVCGRHLRYSLRGGQERSAEPDIRELRTSADDSARAQGGRSDERTRPDSPGYGEYQRIVPTDMERDREESGKRTEPHDPDTDEEIHSQSEVHGELTPAHGDRHGGAGSSVGVDTDERDMAGSGSTEPWQADGDSEDLHEYDDEELTDEDDDEAVSDETDTVSVFSDVPTEISPDSEYANQLLEGEIIRGSGYYNGKFRINDFIAENNPSNNELAKFLKNEYGIGGHSGNDTQVKFCNHDGKGFELVLKSTNGDDQVARFSWAKVAEAVRKAVDSGRYITDKDIETRRRIALYDAQRYSIHYEYPNCLENDRITYIRREISESGLEYPIKLTSEMFAVYAAECVRTKDYVKAQYQQINRSSINIPFKYEDWSEAAESVKSLPENSGYAEFCELCRGAVSELISELSSHTGHNPALGFTDGEVAEFFSSGEVLTDSSIDQISSEVFGYLYNREQHEKLWQKNSVASVTPDQPAEQLSLFGDNEFSVEEPEDEVPHDEAPTVSHTNSAPTITCEWSESSVFEEGRAYSVLEFDTIMKQADDEWVAKRQREIDTYGNDYDKIYAAYEKGEIDGVHQGYAKTMFTVNLPDGTTYTERQDIGDGYGGVIDFLSQYTHYKGVVEELKKAAEIENNTADIVPEEQLEISEKGRTEVLHDEAPDLNSATPETFRQDISEHRLIRIAEQETIGSAYPVFDAEKNELSNFRLTFITDQNAYRLIADSPKVGPDVYIHQFSHKDTAESIYTYLHERDMQVLHDEAPMENSDTQAQHRAAPAVGNYHFPEDFTYPSGAKAKYSANVTAIKTLKQIEAEHRHATAEEQEILAQYSGWGGIADAFDPDKENWSKEYAELKDLLTDREYAAARESTLTAFYTEPYIINSIYKALDNMGFTGGDVLDPAMGTGNFFGSMPPKMAENSRLYGVELDSLTARIAKELYPEAKIQHRGFEHSKYENGTFDVIIGNVPFGEFKPYDPEYSDYFIHDYFFAKSIDKLKSGGIMALITSAGTMDKTDDKLRRELSNKANFIGGIRLPEDAFRTAGTQTVTDILFFQKLDQEHTYSVDDRPNWINSQRLYESGSIYFENEYFHQNPEMVLGNTEIVSGRYGNVRTIKSAGNTPDRLSEAVEKLKCTFSAEPTVDDELPEEEYSDIPDGVLPYTYYVKDDTLYYAENRSAVPFNDKDEARIKAMCEILARLDEVTSAQKNGCSDDELKVLQTRLNNTYDGFTKKYGYLNSRTNISAFGDDVRAPRLAAIENVEELPGGKQKITKADIFTQRTINTEHLPTHVDTVLEAMHLSLNTRQTVDLEYISQLCGKDKDEVISELGDRIYCNPAKNTGGKYTGWETAEEYLSGHVRSKLDLAQEVAKTNPDFERNVAALLENQPPRVGIEDIGFRLGTIYIPPEMFQQFVYDTFDTPQWQRQRPNMRGYAKEISVAYSPELNQWKITNAHGQSGVLATETYGTSRLNAYELTELLLNQKRATVNDYREGANGKTEKIFNVKETILARECQDKIEQAFHDWVMADKDRIQTIEDRFNSLYNNIKPRTYNGEYITVPGMNPNLSLRPHQKNVIARIAATGTCMMAHEVGAGKTAAMGAAGMYLKSIGACTKPMYVVPNAVVAQFGEELQRFFPEAKILVATSKDMEKSQRRHFLSKISVGNYDAIVIPQSQFEKMPLSLERQEAMYDEKLIEISNAIQAAKADKGERFTVKALERQRKQIEKKIEKMRAAFKKDDFITFEELGCDFLFVDEAHNYKNLAVFSKMNNVAGVNANANSQKAFDMEMKCRYLQELHHGGGVVFATGTPVITPYQHSNTEFNINARFIGNRHNLNHR